MKDASGSASSSAPPQDPWHTTGKDPWANFHGTSKAGPPSQHVQQKFEEVEQKMTDRVQAALDAKMQQLPGDEEARLRLDSVESQIQSILVNQHKLENWAVDNGSKVAIIQSEQANMNQAMQQCQQTICEQGQALTQLAQEVTTCSHTLSSQGHTLQQVAQDVGGLQRDLTSQLEAYFSKQATTIEALIEKRQRHS